MPLGFRKVSCATKKGMSARIDVQDSLVVVCCHAEFDHVLPEDADHDLLHVLVSSCVQLVVDGEI